MKNKFLLVTVVVLVLVIGGLIVYLNKQSNIPPQNLLTDGQKPPELVGKWMVVSVEENSVQIVPEGSGATIEFLDNGTYSALGGCNEMFISSYAISGSRISFKVGGTKKKCAKNIVEFWDLGKVYSYEFNDKVLLLRYKTDSNIEGVFRFQKI